MVISFGATFHARKGFAGKRVTRPLADTRKAFQQHRRRHEPADKPSQQAMVAVSRVDYK